MYDKWIRIERLENRPAPYADMTTKGLEHAVSSNSWMKGCVFCREIFTEPERCRHITLGKVEQQNKKDATEYLSWKSTNYETAPDIGKLG
jgi:hypothetical protein